MKDNIWWLNPMKLMLGVIFPIFVLLCFYPFNFSNGVMYNVPNYIDFEIFFYGFCFFLFFCLGYTLRFKQKKKEYMGLEYISPKFLCRIGIVAIAAHIIWFSFLFKNPSLLLQTLFQHYMAKQENKTIPGVTTFSQLGVLYVIIYQLNKRVIKPTFKLRLIFYIMVFLSVLRAIIWSERLAIIETAVSIVVISFRYVDREKIKAYRWRLIQLLPYLGIVLLFIVFGVFEYFRSWDYYQKYYNSIITFSLQRVFLYYYGSVNTAAAILKMTNWPSYSFYSFFAWIYDFPVLTDYLYKIKPQEPYGADYMVYLEMHLDPEFNNASGLLMPFTDSGVIGALLCAFLLGSVSRFAYEGFKEGQGLGIYIYPIVFISIMDILREPYFCTTRIFPVVLFAIIGQAYYSKRLSP